MAVDMFLKLDGIAGESQDAQHKGENDVLAWNWGGSQNGSMHFGEGGGAGKASFSDLTVTKFVDKGSATLLQYMAKGTHIAKGKLIVRKAGEKPLEFLKFDMEQIIVTHYTTSGSGGDDRLTESVSLNFRKWKLTYTPQTKQGGGAGAVDFGFDIAANKAA